MKRALVTGGSGQVGGAIITAAARHGFDVVAPDRNMLDLGDPDSISAAVGAADWSVIINCAAYTAVDKAQDEPALANAINHAAPGLFASEAALRSIPIVHISTDYVFDGSKEAAYVEDDMVHPLGVYGVSKEAGEAAVRAGNPAHAIIRTAWVVSAGGANFINTMLRLAQTRGEVGVVADQFGCPTSAADIADAVLRVADRITDPAPFASGTWHFVNSGRASWHDLAALVFEEVAARGLKTPELRAITTAEYPTPARRPVNSQLDTTKITRDFNIVPRQWQDAIKQIMEERLQDRRG